MTMLVDTRTARRPWPSRAVVGGVVCVAVAGAAGWAIGGSVGPPEPVAIPAPIVSVGGFEVQVSPAWSAAEAAPGPEVPGGRAFAPAAGLPARVLLVADKAAGPSLLPASLRAELGTSLPRPRRARVAGRRAWRYGPVRGDERVLSVTVLPTTTGVLAVACSAPPETWSVALGCAAGVEAVAPHAGRILEPSADLAFRRGAPAVLRRFDDRRRAGRTALARTRRPGARAGAARRLAAGHREAASALAPLSSEGAPAAAVAALRRAARAYDRLAAAARARAAGRQRSAAAAVRRSDAALRTALDRLRPAAVARR